MKSAIYIRIAGAFLLLFTTMTTDISAAEKFTKNPSLLRSQDSTGSFLANSSKTNTVKQKLSPAGWQLQITLSAETPKSKRYQEMGRIVLGEVNNEKTVEDSVDQLCNKGSEIEIYIPDIDGEDDSEKYCSDYYPFTKDNSDEKETWIFQVRSSDTTKYNALPMKIDIEGIYRLSAMENNNTTLYTETAIDRKELENFMLIDLDKQIAYLSYEFKDLPIRMDGLHTRTFKLLRGVAKQEDYKWESEKNEPIPIAETKKPKPQTSNSRLVEALSKSTVQTRSISGFRQKREKKSPEPEFTEDPPIINGHFAPPPEF